MTKHFYLECTEIECDKNAIIKNLTQQESVGIKGLRCGVCVCLPGWAGTGFLCGRDEDADGWPDDQILCQDIRCTLDNCKASWRSFSQNLWALITDLFHYFLITLL